jgi:hypothetical protein
VLRAAAGFWIAGVLAGQTLEVHTEFLRTDPGGRILAVDATESPRELISPAVVRNAWVSFQVVVDAPDNNYFLFVGSNPPGVFRTSVYKLEFTRRGEDWIPDALTPVKMPNFGVIPDPEAAIPGQTARAYVVDVWVPADAPVGRTRLEIQLKAGTWTIWPMELRILPAVVPAARVRSTAPLPDLALRADEAAMAPLVDYIGRHGEGPAKGAVGKVTPAVEPRTLRELIRRNVEQDMTLARTLDARTLTVAIREKIDRPAGGEWYLGVRDLIYRLASGGARE